MQALYPLIGVANSEIFRDFRVTGDPRVLFLSTAESRAQSALSVGPHRPRRASIQGLRGCEARNIPTAAEIMRASTSGSVHND
jgi:hypothetical protein